MRRFLRSVVVVIACALATPASADKLSASQAAAKAKFDKRIQFHLEEFEESCGYAVTVAADFEAYREQDWSETAPEKLCGFLLDGLSEICSDEPTEEREKVARDVKRIACSFTGHQPKGESGTDAHTQANLEVADGTLTMHLGPGLANLDQNVKTALRRARGEDLGWNLAAGQVGTKCDRWQQCSSSVCSKNKCSKCSAKLKCQKPGAKCYDGSCWTDAELERARRAAAESKPASKPSSDSPKSSGKGLGKSCTSSSECRSDLTCKPVSKSRSTCR